MATGQLLRPPGILIADDEEAVCFSLGRELRRQGIAVHIAANGKAALELYAVHRARIDAVFLDVRMPLLDGVQVLAALRRIDPGVRCCLMTAYAQEAYRCRGDSLGGAAVLEKPFDLDDFVEILARLLPSKSTPPGIGFAGSGFACEKTRGSD